MFNEIFIQGIGFIGLILILLIYQIDNRKAMLSLRITASILFGFHFGLLQAWTGSALNFIGAIRTYIFKQRLTKKWAESHLWLYLFIIIFVIVGIFTWEGNHSILPIIGMTAGTISFWVKNPKHIRFISLFPPLIWFVYDFIVLSYPAMILEILLFSSVIIGIIRFDILKKKSVPESKTK